jgi:hypothetical protein
LAVVVAIVRIIVPSISVWISQPEKYAAAEPSKSAAMEPAAVEPPKSGVESAAMEPAAMEPAAMEPAKSATMEPATAAVRPGVSEIWLAERGSAQQSSCDH